MNCAQRLVYGKCKHTWFEKGNLPRNSKEDGAVSIRKDSTTRKPYKFIRVSLGVWVHLHRYVWEQAHGHIPKDRIIIFKDGDSMNCDISNLEMITKMENGLRNKFKIHELPEELQNTMRLKFKLNKLIKDGHKKQNNGSK